MPEIQIRCSLGWDYYIDRWQLKLGLSLKVKKSLRLKYEMEKRKLIYACLQKYSKKIICACVHVFAFVTQLPAGVKVGCWQLLSVSTGQLE